MGFTHVKSHIFNMKVPRLKFSFLILLIGRSHLLPFYFCQSLFVVILIQWLSEQTFLYNFVEEVRSTLIYCRLILNLHLFPYFS